jgi:hypothetical protein
MKNDIGLTLFGLLAGILLMGGGAIMSIIEIEEDQAAEKLRRDEGQAQMHAAWQTIALANCQRKWNSRKVAVIQEQDFPDMQFKFSCMVQTESGEYVPEANISLK